LPFHSILQSYSSWAAGSSLKQAQSDVPQTWEATPGTLDNVQTTTLDSGLKVTTVSSELPLAAVSLHVKAGARFETGESRGAAHFLRHLAFSVRAFSPSHMLIMLIIICLSIRTPAELINLRI
jgi:hypothetical protein